MSQPVDVEHRTRSPQLAGLLGRWRNSLRGSRGLRESCYWYQRARCPEESFEGLCYLGMSSGAFDEEVPSVAEEVEDADTTTPGAKSGIQSLDEIRHGTTCWRHGAEIADVHSKRDHHRQLSWHNAPLQPAALPEGRSPEGRDVGWKQQLGISVLSSDRECLTKLKDMIGNITGVARHRVRVKPRLQYFFNEERNKLLVMSHCKFAQAHREIEFNYEASRSLERRTH